MVIIAIIAIISFILQIVFTVNIAEDKGESVAPWVILTLFLGWIGVLILYLSTRSQESQYNDFEEENYELRNDFSEKDEEGKDAYLTEYLEKHSNKEQIDWCCKCGTRNSIHRNTCSTCGKERIDNAAKKSAIDNNAPVTNDWFCLCGARNPEYRKSCSVCGKSKPQ